MPAEAEGNGLVDVLGDCQDALNIAAARAHLQADDYKVQRLPRQRSAFEAFMARFSDDPR